MLPSTSSAAASTADLFEEFVMPTYGRFPVALDRGEGASLWDEAGKRYLDFGTGIAVCPLGHADPVLAGVIRTQAEKLLHCSNLYLNRPQGLLARHLAEKVVGLPGKVFFCNSGAEANEALIKLARKYGHENPGASGQARTEMITFEGSFHGRTMAGISATGQAKVKEPFHPLLPGFRHVPFNDLDAVRAALTPETVAILLEPVQGEGGIHVAEADFLRGVAALCREHDLLLIYDEVQCGVGRLGAMAGWRAVLDEAEVAPHAMSWAKGLGGGIPIGAMWASADRGLCDVLGPGTHGSTFGGGPLVASVALTVLEEIEKRDLLRNARVQGDRIIREIEAWGLPTVKAVRGMGLMLGIVLREENLEALEPTPALHVVNRLMDAGLLTVPAGPAVVRFLPPLNVTEAEVTEALALLQTVLQTLDPT